MAVLDSTNRARVASHFRRVTGQVFAGILKPELRAAIDATDDWIEANQSSYNLALPLPARTALTLTQKTLLFCFVAMRRAGVLKVEED